MRPPRRNLEAIRLAPALCGLPDHSDDLPYERVARTT